MFFYVLNNSLSSLQLINCVFYFILLNYQSIKLSYLFKALFSFYITYVQEKHNHDGCTASGLCQLKHAGRPGRGRYSEKGPTCSCLDLTGQIERSLKSSFVKERAHIQSPTEDICAVYLNKTDTRSKLHLCQQRDFIFSCYRWLHKYQQVCGRRWLEKLKKRPHQVTSVIVFVVLAYYDTRSLFRLVTTVKTGLRSRDEVFNNHQKQLWECAE